MIPNQSSSSSLSTTYTSESFTAITATGSLDRLLLVMVDESST
jgi:hypothetical protein